MFISDTELTTAIDDIICDFPNAAVYVIGSASEKLPSKFISLDNKINDADSNDIDPAVRSDQDCSDPAVYIFTSGTTGEFHDITNMFQYETLFHFM